MSAEMARCSSRPARAFRVLGLPLTAATTPAPTTWAHDSARAWTAAWLTVRRRTYLGTEGDPRTIPIRRASSTGAIVIASSAPGTGLTWSALCLAWWSRSRSSSRRSPRRGASTPPTSPGCQMPSIQKGGNCPLAQVLSELVLPPPVGGARSARMLLRHSPAIRYAGQAGATGTGGFQPELAAGAARGGHRDGGR